MATVRDRSGNFSGALTSAGVDSRVSTDIGIQSSEPVTPSDSVDLPDGTTIAVSCGVSGNAKVTYSNGQIDTIYLNAGQWTPAPVKRVWVTGTTATSIVAGY